MKEELTPAEIAIKLSAELGFEVSPLVVTNPKDETDVVVGYLKQPNREAKRAIVDEMMKSPTTAGKTYLECALIKDKSDPRFVSAASEHDSIVLGAELACIPLIEFYQSQIKKK